MSRELHDTFRLSLETVSPVHVGSGKDDLLADYDFVVAGKRAKVMDLGRLFHEMAEEKLEVFANDPRLSAMLSSEEVEQYTAYEIQIASAHPPERIRRHVRDVFDRVYIPGSSVKGALRTALGWSAHHGALTLGGTSERRDPTQADDSLEAALFDYDLRSTQRDLLRALRVTDGYPESDFPTTVLPVDVFSLRGQPPSLQPKGEPLFVEAIPRGTVVEALLTLDRYALRPERRVRGMHHSRRRHFFDQLAERCRQFSGQLLNLELDFYGDCAVWKLQGFYETLARKHAALGSDEFFMPVGWGTGWLGKTLGTKLTDRERQVVAETYHIDTWQGPLFPQVFPKTRHLVGDVVAREPLGWVKVRLESLGV